MLVLVFQPNGCDMILLPPLFSKQFEYIYIHKQECIRVVIGCWGGSWGPTGPPLPPLPLPSKMTPKCGRIDVKYANCSYCTRIGLGKWTHDPTLFAPETH